MPIFKYKGYDDAGSEIEGIIEADGHRDAATKIKSTGIFPKEISEEVSSGKKILFKKYSPLVLAGITRSLSTLISSGVPLVNAIAALSSEQKGEWNILLIDIKERVSGGSSLARALEAHPEAFPDYYTGMISAGETSGKLNEVLLKLADFLETEISLKNKVKTALVYPIFMALISFFVLIFLFTFVIPKVSKIFEATSASLPFITVVLISISAVFKQYWWLLLIAITSAILLYRKIKEKNKKLIDNILLREPMKILTGLYMLRFTMTLGFLLSGGLPILYAMQLTAKATGNVVLEDRIMSARDLISQGAKLSTSLEGFPPTLLQIIATGEQTGKLPEILEKTAKSYDAEFDRKLQRAISLLEPSLILTMGLIVGFIVVAVLLPIFELNQIVQ
jgi:general secretion pathway protein F